MLAKFKAFMKLGTAKDGPYWAKKKYCPRCKRKVEGSYDALYYFSKCWDCVEAFR